VRKSQKVLKELSNKLVEFQKPIRILDAIKWDHSIFNDFKHSNFKSLPKIGPQYYLQTDLGFDPKQKKIEFNELKKEIDLKLNGHPAKKIISPCCNEYIRVIEMLEARGTKRFYEISKELYGSYNDYFLDNKTTTRQLAHLLKSILDVVNFKQITFSEIRERNNEKTIPSSEVVKILNKRLNKYFHSHQITVLLDDGIVSDAAAGSNYIKIKKDIFFSKRELEIFEVHEGWVHVGTTLNGLSQKYCTWLSKGTPTTTAIQEGLAILMEIFMFVSSPQRAERINNRVIACEMAEKGANFLEVYNYFRSQGAGEESSFLQAQRIFRGGIIEGGAPFTKDLVYCKGFVTLYNFLRTAVKLGKTELVLFLFSGKVKIEDLPILYELYLDKTLTLPKYVPAQFQDLRGISTWMAFSNFFNKMDLELIQENIKLQIAS